MPDPKLQSYLAQHYLSGPKADAILARNEDGHKKKKKKRQRQDEALGSNGLTFRDDDDSWKAETNQEDEDVLRPQLVASGSGTNTKGFKKLWSKEGEAEASPDTDAVSTPRLPDHAEAATATVMKAGLRSKAEMRAARQAREARREQEAAEQAMREQASCSAQKTDANDSNVEQQTVYRDRSGRRIDVAEEDAALRAAEETAERRRKERETWGQGLIQRQARDQAAAELDRIRQSKIERRADDRDLNQHLREQQRSDDPALAFITKKRSKAPQVPKYKGPYPPNRFNIAPGYRWDGVDRSNGFEKMLFQRKNTLARQNAEARGTLLISRSAHVLLWTFTDMSSSSRLWHSVGPVRHVTIKVMTPHTVAQGRISL